MFQIVFDNIITLLICMAIGYFCYKKKIITDEINAGLSNLLIKITLPCLIVFSMQKPMTNDLIIEAVIVLFASAFLFISGTAVGLLCCRLLKADNAEKGVWTFALTLPNIVYMGFPVIGAAFGSDSLFYVSIANIAFNMICFSLGIKLITLGRKSADANLMALLRNEAIIATFIGLVLFIFSFELPASVNNALSMVGTMTTPVSMIIVGVLLARGKFSEAFSDLKNLVIVFVRLLVMPVAAFVIFRKLISSEMIFGVLVFMAAMPTAGVTAIFAEKYGGNTDLASKSVFVSTLLSALTIPLISLLL